MPTVNSAWSDALDAWVDLAGCLESFLALRTKRMTRKRAKRSSTKVDSSRRAMGIVCKLAGKAYFATDARSPSVVVKLLNYSYVRFML